MYKYVFIVTFSALLTGCLEQGIDQSSMCRYSTDEETKQCKEGQLSFFRPDSWGNEQLPLVAAALYCDFNHQVMYTKAGVICVFTKQRIKEAGK